MGNTHPCLTTLVYYKKLLGAGNISSYGPYFFFFFSLNHHTALILSLSLSSFAENPWIRSYKRSFNGFAANLTDSESQKLASECCT
jgi:hypothetical protein